MTETTEQKQYKDTLNLPQTTLAMRANATQREPQIQQFWEENNIYEKMLSNRDKSNSNLTYIDFEEMSAYSTSASARAVSHEAHQ